MGIDKNRTRMAPSFSRRPLGGALANAPPRGRRLNEAPHPSLGEFTHAPPAPAAPGPVCRHHRLRRRRPQNPQGPPQRPRLHPPRGLRHRAGRRAAAGQPAHRRRLRRATAGSTSPIRPAPTSRSRCNWKRSRTASSASKTPRATATFDKATVFADKMMFPEGVLWFDGSLYVGAPPSIWKLTDTEGDRHRRPARGVVQGQDAGRLRQRHARPLRRPRRLDLLVQGRLRAADHRPARQEGLHQPGRPRLALPARRHRAGSRS